MPAPPRILRSAAALALATSATGLAYVGTAAPARAAGYNGYCTSSSGVTVVVDFRSLGGGIAVRCAPVGAGATGAQALAAAGIPVVEPARTHGFVCRLYGKPASDPCVNTPPTNAHWDYWKASNGGSWGYSSSGYATSAVIPGGFEGWSFSNGTKAAPGLAPSRPAAAPQPTTRPKPAPSHTTTRPPARHTTTTAAPQHSAPAGGTHSHSSSAVAGHKTSAAHSSTSSASSTSHGTTTSGAAAGSTSGGTAVLAGGKRLADSDKLIGESNKSSGLNATTVVGGIVLAVLVLGGGAVAIVRRRNVG